MNMRITVLSALLLIEGLGDAQAQTGAAFLKASPSARTYALGMSNSVCALGAEAIGSNPANLGFMSRRFEAFSSFAALAGGAQYAHMAAALERPFGALPASFGLSYTSLRIGGMDGADVSGNKTGGSFDANDSAIGLTGSGAVSHNLRLGATMKMIQSQIGNYRSAPALASDFGITYGLSTLSRPLLIGLSVNNLGHGVRFLSQTDALPTSINMGLALPIGMMVGVVQASKMLHESKVRFGAGLEFGVGVVSFRAGYTAHNISGSNLALQDQSGPGRLLGGLAGGIGLRVGTVRFDYAVSQEVVEFGASQRISFSVAFGGKYAPPQPAPRPGRSLQMDPGPWWPSVNRDEMTNNEEGVR